MKKEFEIYRSNFYGVIFLIASVLSFILGVIFIFSGIEWSLFLVTVFFILFVGFMAIFAWLFLRPFIVATVSKEKITIYDGKIIEIRMEDIEKVEIDSNLLVLKLNIHTENGEEKFEWFVSKVVEVKVILQDFFEKIGKEVITPENYIK